MQQDQFKGMLDRALAVIVTMILGWMVKKGWLGEADAATLAPAIVILPAVAWGWWVNRDKALLQSAANVPAGDGKRTIILTSPELAKDTPELNIISNTATHKAIGEAVKEVTKEPT